MTMKEGGVNSIEYMHWDGSLWIATLQDVAWKVNAGFIKVCIDPDWHHVRPPPSDDFSRGHDDDLIGYITGDNSQWSSKCHSHTIAEEGRATFTFEHFRRGNKNKDHEDGTIKFFDWQRNYWQLNADDVFIPKTGSVKVPLRITRL